MDNFSENFQRRGVISDPKNFVADFLVILRGKTMIFLGGEGGIVSATLFSETRAGRGGGSQAIWKFSKNSSKMEQESVP